MSRVTPAQASFNGGELAERLQDRFDLAIYDNAVAEMLGAIPLPEGGFEWCPGTIWVEQAAGPCRLLPFEYNVTQGHVLELSALKIRIYTNDARIEDEGEPVEVDTPYSYAQCQSLDYEQSFDVLYLFHGEVPVQEFVRTGADEFSLSAMVIENGPFEPRNKDESITVSADGVTGDVTLTASDPIFAAGDVGGLFQMEADDFGDIPSWAPGITVEAGQYRVWGERVYRSLQAGRTGPVEPVHSEGVEWDGMGTGTDINDEAAPGVQWEYIHDRIGILRITAFSSATEVDATVERRLPFTAATSYSYEGGYWDPEFGVYVPPTSSISYVFGTWRWSFGAFSTTRGFPQAGVIYGERLWLFKGATCYASVVGDFGNHAKYNDLGEVTADMALIHTLTDPNPIVHAVADKDLIVLTMGGEYAVGASSAASPIGPGNVGSVRQSNFGARQAKPVIMDGRIMFVQKSRRRIMEAGYRLDRDRIETPEMTRYARHIGNRKFIEIAGQKEPNRLIWAVMQDGTLSGASYVPEENVLGWFRRELGGGLLARSITTITDPDGELNQLWIAAQTGDDWHVLRMAPIRQDGESDENAVMVDMAVDYDGAPVTSFGPVDFFASQTIDIVADSRIYAGFSADGSGNFILPNAHSRVVAGFGFPARVTTLTPEAGGDNGPAIGKMKRISRALLGVKATTGISLQVQGTMEIHLGEATPAVPLETPASPMTRYLIVEDAGEYDRQARSTIRRTAPKQGTITLFQPTMEVKQK